MTSTSTLGSITDEAVTFGDLPTDVMKHVVSYLGNAPDLLSCERTCKRLQSVISDDTLWRNDVHAEDDPRMETNREHMCITYNLNRAQKQAKETENVLLSVFPTEQEALAHWRTIVTGVLLNTLPDRLLIHQVYYVRWDTLRTMLDILEAFLTSSFERAMLIVLSCRCRETYPRVDNFYLTLQNELGQRATPAFRYFVTGGSALANSLLDEEKRHRLVRKIALRSGVPRLENDVFDSAWGALISLVEHLWHPICEKHVGMASSVDDTVNTKRRQIYRKDWKETMRRIPPYPTISTQQCSSCARRTVRHTPVPLELEEIADRLLPTAPLPTYPDYLDKYEDHSNVEVAQMCEHYEILEDRKDNCQEQKELVCQPGPSYEHGKSSQNDYSDDDGSYEDSQEDYSDDDGSYEDDSYSAVSYSEMRTPRCPLWWEERGLEEQF